MNYRSIDRRLIRLSEYIMEKEAIADRIRQLLDQHDTAQHAAQIELQHLYHALHRNELEEAA